MKTHSKCLPTSPPHVAGLRREMASPNLCYNHQNVSFEGAGEIILSGWSSGVRRASPASPPIGGASSCPYRAFPRKMRLSELVGSHRMSAKCQVAGHAWRVLYMHSILQVWPAFACRCLYLRYPLCALVSLTAVLLFPVCAQESALVGCGGRPRLSKSARTNGSTGSGGRCACQPTPRLSASRAHASRALPSRHSI